jgi:aldehyde:ferredoxin oxidoreductase
MYGYAGTMLTINLTDGKVIKEPLRDDLVRDWIGGEGFGARLLWEKLKPRTDPLSPENVLIFTTTAFSGSVFPPGSRTILNYKSPLTGFYGENGMGGSFAPYLRFAGYDLLIVEGKAKKPVYIFIDGDEVEIKDATHLWGKLGSETDELLREEIGDTNIQIIRIGPAGETLNRLACMTSDYNRAFGKGGNGAVAGSKNLKAIVVRGRGSIPAYDTAGLKEVSARVYKKCREAYGEMAKTHIHFLNQAYVFTMGIPIRHFQRGNWDKMDRLFAEPIMEQLFTGEDAYCWGCPTKTGKVLSPKKGPYKGHKVDAKVEADWSWGYNMMIDDLDVLCEIFYQCAQNGVDINGSAEWAGWLAECQERGIITPEDVGGLEVKFGDGESCLRLLRAIFAREGFGDVLAEGPKIAAEKLGKGTEKYVMHSKGSPLEAEEFRADKALLLGTATQERGGSVNRTWTFTVTHGGVLHSDVTGLTEKPDPSAEKGIAKWLKPYREVLQGILNTMGGCLILWWPDAFATADVLEGYKYLTGREVSMQEGLKVGEKILNLARAFNAREGYDREKDDTMPERFLTEPVSGGIQDGARVESLDAMIDEFYSECGFDLKTGWPTRAKLEELGLKDVADELYSKGK